MADISGAKVLARSLKQQGVDYVFGIVGFPVVPIAMAMQKEGITFIGMRNEQSASYAAQAAGYLTGRPQGCLVVSGPGVIHALAGLANAKENLWPMILIGGASPTYQNGMGAFQEEDQVAAAKPYCKYAHRVEAHDRIPYYVEQAVRTSLFGRPGPVYLDMPADVIDGRVDEATIPAAPTVGEPPRMYADPDAVRKALDVVKSARAAARDRRQGDGLGAGRVGDAPVHRSHPAPLPGVADGQGRGARRPSAVGRGGPLARARRTPTSSCSPGARLNWIMHYGRQPRFNRDVRIVQLDIHAEQIGTNVADRGGAGRRRQGRHGPAQRRPRRRPLEVRQRHAVADSRSPRRSPPTRPRSPACATTTRPR